jgi:hypothetical protein
VFDVELVLHGGLNACLMRVDACLKRV